MSRIKWPEPGSFKSIIRRGVLQCMSRTFPNDNITLPFYIVFYSMCVAYMYGARGRRTNSWQVYWGGGGSLIITILTDKICMYIVQCTYGGIDQGFTFKLVSIQNNRNWFVSFFMKQYLPLFVSVCFRICQWKSGNLWVLCYILSTFSGCFGFFRN
jgi:hypothetical protein